MDDRAANLERVADVLHDTRVVVVTFGPRIDLLRRQFDRLTDEGMGAIVVDNASPNVDEVVGLAGRHGFEMVRLPTNVGVAAAHNVGFDAARAQGASYVVLLDHDSIPEPGAFASLATAYLGSSAVAAIGSVYAPFDQDSWVPFTRTRWFGTETVACPDPPESVVEVDLLISSGTFFPLSTIDAVGPMMEELFIDRVDIEWCLRPRALGYRVYGACGSRIRHALGARPFRVWFGRWRTPTVHAGFRYYYMVRNSLWLYRQPYAPLRWITADAAGLLRMALVVSILPGRGPRVRALLRGLRDGLTTTYTD